MWTTQELPEMAIPYLQVDTYLRLYGLSVGNVVLRWGSGCATGSAKLQHLSSTTQPCQGPDKRLKKASCHRACQRLYL